MLWGWHTYRDLCQFDDKDFLKFTSRSEHIDLLIRSGLYVLQLNASKRLLQSLAVGIPLPREQTCMTLYGWRVVYSFTKKFYAGKHLLPTEERSLFPVFQLVPHTQDIHHVGIAIEQVADDIAV